jgi:serine/threonine protein kinase
MMKKFMFATGVGAYGKVWRADLGTYLPNGQCLEVAVKSIKDSASRVDISNFLLESDSLKAVNANGGHSNVLKLIGCALQELPPLIITEYAVHGNLQSYLESTMRLESRVDVGVLLRFAKEAACGMAFLADLQIVHRGTICLRLWLSRCAHICLQIWQRATVW